MYATQALTNIDICSLCPNVVLQKNIQLIVTFVSLCSFVAGELLQ